MGRKFLIFSTIILILSFSSCICFATNLTGNEFKELLKNNNIEISDDLTIPSNVTTILNSNPIIITNNDNTKVLIYGNNATNLYPMFSPVNYDQGLQWTFGLTNDSNKNTNLYYSGYINSIPSSYCGFYGGGSNQNMAVYDIANQNFQVKKYFGYDTYGLNSNSTYVVNLISLTKFGFIYNSNEYTESDFKSPKTMKKYLDEHLLFSGQEIIYSGYTNLLYKFDGVFKGNTSQKPYTSSFIANNDMFRFEYTAYTDLTDSNVVNYFYLQEFTPSEAVNLTDEDLKFTDSDEQIFMNQKLESNFSYTSLIRRMQEGYIYRLYCFSNQHDSNGDLIRTTDSTSCFFSLNSWKSNAITVLNIYELMFPENPDIEQEGGTSGGVTDLENIQNSINDLNNNITTVPDISNTTITSGEITDSLNFEFAEDPYANFWLELTTRTFWRFD